MKIHLLSDLHIEIQGFHSIEQTDADLIVLAGDIHTGVEGLNWSNTESERLNTPIIYVAGNHEFYKRDYWQTLREMRRVAAESNLVYFLEQDEIVINDVRFLGTTFWTDYNASEETQEHCMMMCNNLINDHRLINFNGERFTPKYALKLHQNSLKWLYKKLVTPYPGKTVVVTHHGPSKICAHPGYANNVLSGAFYSDLDSIVELSDLWLYGHTHSSIDVQIGNCRLVSNQRGYPREEIPGTFNQWKVIEL